MSTKYSLTSVLKACLGARTAQGFVCVNLNFVLSLDQRRIVVYVACNTIICCSFSVDFYVINARTEDSGEILDLPGKWSLGCG